MTHATIRIIREEHAALSAMLRSIVLLLAQHRRQGTLPDFATLRAMLFYVDEFPEQRHHRKESELLFPKLRARSPVARELLDRLDSEHANGHLRIRELEHALLAFEMMGEPRRLAFEQAAERYTDFYLAHMALEEREILPLARAHADRAGLGRSRRGLRGQPRPAHRARTRRGLSRTVHPDRQCRARTDRPRRAALMRWPKRRRDPLRLRCVKPLPGSGVYRHVTNFAEICS